MSHQKFQFDNFFEAFPQTADLSDIVVFEAFVASQIGDERPIFLLHRVLSDHALYLAGHTHI